MPSSNSKSSDHPSEAELAARAEKRLMKIPYEHLSPAGRILVDNPRAATPEQRREQFRTVDGSGSGETTPSQLPLIRGVED
jgi:hypothetical protein